MVYNLAFEGSARHDDGCGFICSNNSIWKSELQAKKISNLGRIINHLVTDDNPIPFHIRMATWGIEVTKENAHPFDGKHFILMHNGTLLPRNGEEPKDKKKDSDSLRFLNQLDQARDEFPQAKFEEIFNKAMDNFAGKFAFIIREKETGLDYIIRGRTAELWITYIKQDKVEIGYVINTSNFTLKDAMVAFLNSAQIVIDGDYEFSEPVLLKMETIFLANDIGVEEIGSAKEFTPVKKEEPKVEHPITRFRENWTAPKSNINTPELANILEWAEKIYDFLESHSLGLVDLQIMQKLMDDTSLLELDNKDITFFIEQQIPKLSVSKNVRKQVAKELGSKIFPHEIYKQFDLEYPWMLNEANKVINAIKKYNKQLEAK